MATSESVTVAAEQLREALWGRGIRLDPSELEAALADGEHGPDFEEWARTRLTSDTLLTAEELNM